MENLSNEISFLTGLYGISLCINSQGIEFRYQFYYWLQSNCLWCIRIGLYVLILSYMNFYRTEAPSIDRVYSTNRPPPPQKKKKKQQQKKKQTKKQKQKQKKNMFK